MSSTFPRNLPDPNEVVIIGGLTLAGRIKSVPDGVPEWKFDQQSSGGMIGAIWTFQGFKCAEFTLQMQCVGSMDWERYDAFVGTYGPNNGKIKPKTLPIINAQLNRKGVDIRKVFIRKISNPTWNEGDSSWQYTVTLAQIVDVKIKKTYVVESKYENGLIDPKNRFALPGQSGASPATQKTAPSGWLGVLNGKNAKR